MLCGSIEPETMNLKGGYDPGSDFQIFYLYPFVFIANEG